MTAKITCFLVKSGCGIAVRVRVKMDQLPQLTLLANSEGASKKAGSYLVEKILSEKTFTYNKVFIVVRRIWFTKKVPIGGGDSTKYVPVYF